MDEPMNPNMPVEPQADPAAPEETAPAADPANPAPAEEAPAEGGEQAAA